MAAKAARVKMKISATEAGQAETALVSLDADGVPGRWWLLDCAGVIVRGEGGEPVPTAGRTILSVPGEQVAIHWLELAEGLAPAQAAAAARLLLADSTAEPLADLHVAVGRPEQGRTPIALVRTRLMNRWLASAEASGLDPVAILPSPMLLLPPDDGYSSRERGALSDFRGLAAAFSLEPALAADLLGRAEPEPVSPDRFEAELPFVLAGPGLDLRQGPFARRRNWASERGQARRIAGFALAFLLLTLALQVAMILRYTFAADALEGEVRGLALPQADQRTNFTATAAALFASVRTTPNVELTSLEYRPDESLMAAVQADSPATLAALEQRAEAAGLDTQIGPPRNAGGRQAAILTVRP
jgi:general secretion pathway protein L